MRAVSGHDFSGVITAIGKDVQDFEIGDWFAVGATAEFCITLPQNIGPVRAMELKWLIHAPKESLDVEHDYSDRFLSHA